MCADDHAITRLILQTTPGDVVQYITNPSTGVTYGISAQTVHPNTFGTDLYAATATNALSSTRASLSGTLAAGASTTYDATLRWMEGPTSMIVSAFSSCGTEMRLGLRRGVAGTQDTETLAWQSPHDTQNFVWNATAPSSVDLPADSYAMNARVTTACGGGGTQSWSGELYR